MKHNTKDLEEAGGNFLLASKKEWLTFGLGPEKFYCFLTNF